MTVILTWQIKVMRNTATTAGIFQIDLTNVAVTIAFVYGHAMVERTVHKVMMRKCVQQLLFGLITQSSVQETIQHGRIPANFVMVITTVQKVMMKLNASLPVPSLLFNVPQVNAYLN